MSDTHTMFENDLLPELEVFVFDYDRDTGVETVKDMTGWTLKLYMKLKEDATDYKIDGEELEAVDAEAGEFIYEWQEGDTDEPGIYVCEIRMVNDETEKQRTIDRFDLVIEEAV